MGGDEITVSNRTESNGDGQFMRPATARSCAMTHPFGNVQIYTDSGVMYNNGRNLRHYARVYSISRLHLSSMKSADNTKRAFKYRPHHKFKRKRKLFQWVQSLDICKGQKSFLCSCSPYKCLKKALLPHGFFSKS